MTINAIQEAVAVCVWFVGVELKESRFVIDGLTPITTEVVGTETVAEYILRVFQIDAVSGGAGLLAARVVSATTRRSKKGQRVEFIVDGGRKLGFWTEAQHGPFIKDLEE